MAAMSHSESRRLYSWWWDSHISPKNSKWLQENLTDMDAKVKSMIKLIEEDADSFARRAEMYYKKRPELMKLVEEFYRAYRALAERYDHANVELQHAQRTIAKAFPDQIPSELAYYSPSAGPHTLELNHHPVRSLFDLDYLDDHSISLDFTRNGDDSETSGNSEKILENGFSKLLNENQKLKIEVNSESVRASRAENDVQALRKNLKDLQCEGEAVLLQYRQSLEKLSNLEKQLQSSQKEAKEFDEKANKAKLKKKTLKSSVLELETETQNLKQELSRMEAEKEAGVLRYKQCLEKISFLENKIFFSKENAKKLNERADIAENEVDKLKQALKSLNEEKEAVDFKYKQCLETIERLENEICRAQEDVKQINSEIITGDAKLKNAEEKLVVLDKKSQNLRSKVENLEEKLVICDQQILDKNEDLEKLQIRLDNENSRFLEIEARLLLSQEELKDLQVNKHTLEEEIRQIKEENQSLSEKNLSLTKSMENMKNEIFNLKKIKEKFEEEAEEQVNQSNSLNEEISFLKKEMKVLNQSYQALREQVPLMKELQDENSKLKDISENKENLEKILENSEKSIVDLNKELAQLKEEKKALQESIQYLQGEKSILVSDKATLFSHLQILTENIQKLWEKNALLENTLAAANVELAGLREKSKGLVEICELLRNDKSILIEEKGSLICQLKKMENKFTELEEKYKNLEKEKTFSLHQIEELRISLGVEIQEHEKLITSSGSWFAWLENYFREEDKMKKKLIEEDLDESMNAQVEIFILQKFIQDLEEKNQKLLLQCKKHVEESRLSDKLITELEGENRERQMESEFLLDEIEKLRNGISQVFETLQIDPGTWFEDKIESENAQRPSFVKTIEKMKYSALKNEEKKHLLLVENMVLTTLLEQLKKGYEESKSIIDYKDKKVVKLSQEIEFLRELNVKLESDLYEFQEEIEERRVREENLSSELQGKRMEFELSEAEAATFYFNLQFSSVREVLLENKVHELTDVCANLEEKSVSKSMEIEVMKEKLSFLETENGELKAELSAYVTFINSLEEDIASLERNALFRMKFNSSRGQELEDLEINGEISEKNCTELTKNKITAVPHGISNLQKMKNKIKAVEKTVMEEMDRLSKEKSLIFNTKQKTPMKEIEIPKSKRTIKEKIFPKENKPIEEISLDYFNLPKSESEVSEPKSGSRMKDILLDQESDCAVSVIIRRKNGGSNEQMLELWQTAEQNCSSNSRVKELIKLDSSSMEENTLYYNQPSLNPSTELEAEKELSIDKLEMSRSIRDRTREAHKRRILERLGSDAQKLMSIQVVLQELSMKTGAEYKNTKKKNREYETVNKKMQEINEAVVQLMDMNGQLMKSIENPYFSENKISVDIKEAGNVQRRRVLEQARRGSEKIEQLQLEVQKIQYGLVKMEDERKVKASSKSKTSIALKSFVLMGRNKSIRRRKKDCLCGCLRPSTTESDEIILLKNG